MDDGSDCGGPAVLIALAERAPLLRGVDTLAFIGIDSTQKRVYGHHEQGAKFGHSKIRSKSLLVRGLNALAAVVSTPLSAPAIAATSCAAATPPPRAARPVTATHPAPGGTG